MLTATTASSAPAGPGGAGGAGGPGAGGGFARAAQSTAHPVSVHLTAPVTLSAVLLAVALALAGGLIAGSFGGWRAVRLPPAATHRPREEHAAADSRGAGPPDLGHRPVRRPGSDPVAGEPANPGPRHLDRLHLPVFQTDPDPVARRTSRPPWSRSGWLQLSGKSARCARSPKWASVTGPGTCPRSCPAASSSESPSPAPWSSSPPRCWP